MKSVRNEIQGRRFKRLLVMCEGPKYVSPKWQRQRNVWCLCDCGSGLLVRYSDLMAGKSASCGCSAIEHGHASAGTQTPTYRAWANMLLRCGNPKSKGFENYGGRGITVCDFWRTFASFLSDMGECPDGLTIERINTNGNYEPGNCKWATWHEQSRNKRSSVLATIDGNTLCLANWAREAHINRGTLSAKAKLVGVEKAIAWALDRRKVAA